ncbi:MAG: hypothetical protein ACPLXP_00470 [Microgenomates group bacterium]
MKNLAVLFFKWLSKIKRSEIVSLLVLGVFIFLSAKALFHPGFFRTIDDITTVRIMYLEKELKRGEWFNNFPVRWSGELSHRYGYPLYLFYAPLVYYAGALLMMIGKLSHIVATKWVYVFPLLVGPLLFYWAARQKLSRFSALIASCFYTLFPFRGYDTYIRGGVGEAWAMAFLPAMVGGLFLLEKKKRIGGLIFALFLFLSIISHNLGGLLAISFSLLFGLVFLFKNKDFWKFFLLGIGLASFFWLPSLFYLRIVKVYYSPQNIDQVFNFLVPFSKLMAVNFHFLPEDKFSGTFFYLLIFGAIVFFRESKKMKQKQKKECLFWGGIGFFLYFLLSTSSSFFWEITLPISRMMQFPWRVLIILSFVLPFIFGFCLDLIKNILLKIGAALLLIIFLLTFLPAFRPKEYSFFYEYSAEDTGPCATSWGEEYLPVWTKECPDRPPQEDLVTSGDSQIRVLKNNIVNIEAIIEGEKESELIVNRYYFPGWKVLIDGKEYPVEYKFSDWGIFKTNIPQGEHHIRVFFSKTKIMWLADMVSFISFLIFFFVATHFFLTRRLFFLRKRRMFKIKNLWPVF